MVLNMKNCCFNLNLASFAMKGRPASILQTPNQNVQVEYTQQVCVLHYTYSDHSQG